MYLAVRDFGAEEMHFGFGHIFEDGGSVIEGITLGNFTIKQMANSTFLAIIYHSGSTPVAYAQQPGQVEYNGNFINAQQSVIAGSPIAPVGDSGGNYGAHIHLYRFANIPDGSSLIHTNSNCNNPLVFLDHNEPVWQIALDEPILKYGSNYSENCSSIKARCEISAANPAYVSPGNQPYYQDFTGNIEKLSFV